MIGYGPFHYRYASGREGDAHLLALSPRKNYISLYVLCTTDGAYLAESYRERLPKANIGKSCVRFKRTSDIDLDQLRDAARRGRAPRPALRGDALNDAEDGFDERVDVLLGGVPRAHPAHLAGVLVPDVELEVLLQASRRRRAGGSRRPRWP